MQAALKFLVPALVAAILFGGENLAQQNNTQLTPEQQQTVEKFINSKWRYMYPEYTKQRNRQETIDAVKDIDPILVSKYLVFSKD